MYSHITANPSHATALQPKQATSPKPKWKRGPSPKDGRTYRTLLKNCIDDIWESTATADPTAHYGWRNGNWQDLAKEVKAYAPMDPQNSN